MGSDSALSPSRSLFSRLLSSRRSTWQTPLIGVLLIMLPIVAAVFDGNGAALWRDGTWRVALQAPIIIIYVLVVAPMLERGAMAIVDAYRPLVPMDEEGYDLLVSQASRINPAGEVVAFAAGVVLSGLAQEWTFDEGTFWLWLCTFLLRSLMLGLLGVTIYAAVASTRLTRALHSQPLRVDIFDSRPFKSVGRQSLSMALVFIGGIVLSTLLTLGRLDFRAWQNWLIYLVLTLVPLALFFLSMGDAHRVLVEEKTRELDRVERLVRRSGRALVERLEAGDSVDSLAAAINGLAAYEKRVREARTWPYDTAMLRTLFFSMIVPVTMAVARVAIERLLQ